MNTTIENLYPKFYPYLLGHKNCTATFKSEIDALFEKGTLPFLKEAGPRRNIFDGGKYILKLGRTDPQITTPDTHLYRIRKAVKIQNYIQSNGLEKHIIVSKKYLYWHDKERRFYVVCEKVPLSEEVAQPATLVYEEELKKVGHLGGQLQKLSQGKSRRALTPIQAKALAELSLLGHTDLSYNNLYFTPDGRVAIIDTEPLKRVLKKSVAKRTIGSWLVDKTSLLAQQSIAGIAKLKIYCSDSIALREVEKVERKHALKHIAILVGKIALCCLVIYMTPQAVSLLPVGFAAMKVIKITIIACTAIKTTFLTLNAISVYFVWKWSCQGADGIFEIVQAEMRGQI
jgi:hypothetical protein